MITFHENVGTDLNITFLVIKVTKGVIHMLLRLNTFIKNMIICILNVHKYFFVLNEKVQCYISKSHITGLNDMMHVGYQKMPCEKYTRGKILNLSMQSKDLA